MCVCVCVCVCDRVAYVRTEAAAGAYAFKREQVPTHSRHALSVWCNVRMCERACVLVVAYYLGNARASAYPAVQDTLCHRVTQRGGLLRYV